MANIKRLDGKTGVSFKITVAKGRDMAGKQIRHYKTWTPERPMTERQMEKEVQRVAFEFEREIELGFQADNRQTFAEYAKYVLELKERAGDKYRTLERYGELMERIIPAIGHIKLVDLRPQHLNAFYKALGEEGVSRRADKAHTIVLLLPLCGCAFLVQLVHQQVQIDLEAIADTDPRQSSLLLHDPEVMLRKNTGFCGFSNG